MARVPARACTGPVSTAPASACKPSPSTRSAASAVVSLAGPAAAAGRGATLRMRGVREASIEPSATPAFTAPALSQGLVGGLAVQVGPTAARDRDGVSGP